MLLYVQIGAIIHGQISDEMTARICGQVIITFSDPTYGQNSWKHASSNYWSFSWPSHDLAKLLVKFLPKFDLMFGPIFDYRLGFMDSFLGNFLVRFVVWSKFVPWSK